MQKHLVLQILIAACFTFATWSATTVTVEPPRSVVFHVVSNRHNLSTSPPLRHRPRSPLIPAPTPSEEPPYFTPTAAPRFPIPDSSFASTNDPVLTYGTPNEVIKVDGVSFHVYTRKDCKDSYVLVIRLFDMRRTHRDPQKAHLYALEECTKNAVCHSVHCWGLQCTHFSSACSLVAYEKMRPENSYVFVAVKRTPAKKRLKEMVLSDIRAFKAASSIGNDTQHVPYRCRLFDAGSPLAEEWRANQSNFTEQQKLLPRKAKPIISLTPADHLGFLHHVLVEPNTKTVFFLTPKVASSELIKLYDRLVGHSDYDSLMMQSATHFRFNDNTRERLLLSDLSLEEASALLNAPEYRKVVFFRDPLLRALSAFLDKFHDLNSYAVKVFNRPRREITFTDFVSYISDPAWVTTPNGTGPLANPHWKQQVIVSNLYKFLPIMDVIAWGTPEGGKLALRELGLWEEYGESGWRRGGFMQSGTSSDGHSTGAQLKMDHYYTEALKEKVRRAYTMDYAFIKELGMSEGSGLGDGSSVLRRWDRCTAGKFCWPGNSINERFSPVGLG